MTAAGGCPHSTQHRRTPARCSLCIAAPVRRIPAHDRADEDSDEAFARAAALKIARGRLDELAALAEPAALAGPRRPARDHVWRPGRRPAAPKAPPSTSAPKPIRQAPPIAPKAAIPDGYTAIDEIARRARVTRKTVTNNAAELGAERISGWRLAVPTARAEAWIAERAANLTSHAIAKRGVPLGVVSRAIVSGELPTVRDEAAPTTSARCSTGSSPC
jgi:hypothetical protein